MKRLLVCLAILVILRVAAEAEPKLVQVPSVFGKWQIAFARDHNIWTARGDGTSQKLVIRHAEIPCWSPDKTKLAFYRDGNIWLANADGLDQRQLTHYGRGHANNPDDLRISWNARTGGITFSRPEIWRVRSARGTGEVNGATVLDLSPGKGGRWTLSERFDITDQGTSFSFPDNENPTWARSGNALAFTRNGDIWTAVYRPEDKDGGRAGWDISRLTASARYDSPTYRADRWISGVSSLSWSPDGRQLAYCLERIGGSGQNDLHLVTVRSNPPWLEIASDTTLLADIVTPPGEYFWQPEHPCFSPDGKWILFSSWDSVSTLYAISLDGKKATRLITNASRAVW